MPPPNRKRQVHYDLVRRILIAEFRDEVFGSLRPLFESIGLRVGQARSMAEADHRIHDFEPDLVLINGDLPNGAGWVIRGKLVLLRHPRPAWVYMAFRPEILNQWFGMTSVDDVIAYGGDVSRLIDLLCARIYDPVGPPWRSQARLAAA